MQPEFPSWKEKLRIARASALASLTDEEVKAREADDAANRARRAANNAGRAAQALLVNQRLSLGDKPDEISARLDISLRGLQHRAKRWGHALMQRAGFRRLSAWVADRHVSALDRLAADTGLPRDKALERLLAAALADGGHIARRMIAPVKSVAERAAA